MITTKLLGSEFETSLRILILFDEFSNLTLDGNQVTCIDFIAINGHDFDLLEANLHGDGIFRFSEYSAKSQLISNAIKTLTLSGYLKIHSTKNGFKYSISPSGSRIATKLESDYSEIYRTAIKAVQKKFKNLSSESMQQTIFNMTLNNLEVKHEKL